MLGLRLTRRNRLSRYKNPNVWIVKKINEFSAILNHLTKKEPLVRERAGRDGDETLSFEIRDDAWKRADHPSPFFQYVVTMMTQSAIMKTMACTTTLTLSINCAFL